MTGVYLFQRVASSNRTFKSPGTKVVGTKERQIGKFELTIAEIFETYNNILFEFDKELHNILNKILFKT